jgi:hypothetical protein
MQSTQQPTYNQRNRSNITNDMRESLRQHEGKVAVSASCWHSYSAPARGPQFSHAHVKPAYALVSYPNTPHVGGSTAADDCGWASLGGLSQRLKSGFQSTSKAYTATPHGSTLTRLVSARQRRCYVVAVTSLCVAELVGRACQLRFGNTCDVTTTAQQRRVANTSTSATCSRERILIQPFKPAESAFLSRLRLPGPIHPRHSTVADTAAAEAEFSGAIRIPKRLQFPAGAPAPPRYAVTTRFSSARCNIR